MDLRIALGLIHELALQKGDHRDAQAERLVRMEFERIQMELQACHREVHRQQEHMRRIHELTKEEGNPIPDIRREAEEALGLDLSLPDMD